MRRSGPGMADPVAKFGRPVDAPYGKIGGLADRNRADLVLQAQRARAFARHARNRFLGRQAGTGCRPC